MERLPDIGWMILCTGLVALVPVGQLCLERGVTRAPGARRAVARALVDVAVAVLATCLFGYAWAHGPSLGGFVGLSPGPVDARSLGGAWEASVLAWYAAAVAGATVIAGSGGAERGRPSAMAISATVVALLVLPVALHWAWGGRPAGIPVGWLARMQLIDQGGVAALHIPAGAAALALAGVLGPRRGRMDADGRPVALDEGEPGLELAGAVLVVAGCMGLVGGARLIWTLPALGGMAAVAVGSAAGALAGMLAASQQRRHSRLRDVRLGLVAGAVAASAGALSGGLAWAACAGAVGGGLAVVADRSLAQAGIDDPVGAVPAHFVAGGWGLVAAAIAVSDGGTASRLSLQVFAACVVAVSSFVVVNGVLSAVDRLLPLRLDPDLEVPAAELATAEYAVVTGEPPPPGDRPQSGDGRPTKTAAPSRA